MTIKHIVISGGGPTGLMSYGAAKYLNNVDFWNIKDIISIHGTSIGALIAVLISLKMKWEDLDDYLIKRPWEKTFEITPDDFLNIFYTKGIVNNKIINIIIEYLLKVNGLSNDVTMEEFYKFNNIELNFYSVEMNKFEKKIINYKTFPTLKLIDGVKMSSAFPILFQPIIMDNNCYIDGGLMCNYPINECIDLYDCELDEILGFKNICNVNESNNIDNDTKLLQYIYFFNSKVIAHIDNENNYKKIPHEVNCIDKYNGNYLQWFEIFTHTDKRIELIDEGINYGNLFYQYYKQMK